MSRWPLTDPSSPDGQTEYVGVFLFRTTACELKGAKDNADGSNVHASAHSDGGEPITESCRPMSPTTQIWNFAEIVRLTGVSDY